jgi:D-alanyl-D-alanine carboxypeptidase
MLVFFLLALLSACQPKVPDPAPAVQQTDIPVLDNAVQAFMTTYQVPGLALAITKGEKLVYVKSYGLADKEANEALKPGSLFRLASVSKSITSVAVMKLVENGNLSLDQKVFGPGSLLGQTYGTRPYAARLLAVTVRHLLHHTAGGWGNAVSDPMFLQPQLSTDALITWTLDNRPLQTDPGTVYDYSNFGYCLLGRVIEKVTGQSYEAYVKSTLLAPLGITTMQVGGSTLADRKPDEVRYYGTPAGGASPYAYNIPRLDAHGGWIASAKDLAKLLVHIDGYPQKRDLLQPGTLQTMITPPALARASGYACGWSVNNAGNWWHLGSLPGTATEWVRTSRGYNWVVLTNTRAGGQYLSDLDGLVWKAVNDNTVVWQDFDQF